MKDWPRTPVKNWNRDRCTWPRHMRRILATQHRAANIHSKRLGPNFEVHRFDIPVASERLGRKISRVVVQDAMRLKASTAVRIIPSICSSHASSTTIANASLPRPAIEDGTYPALLMPSYARLLVSAIQSNSLLYNQGGNHVRANQCTSRTSCGTF